MTQPQISSQSIAYIDEFFDSVPGPDRVAGDHWLSYIAVRHKNAFVLLAGILSFNLGSRRPPVPTIDDEMVIAGEIELSDCRMTPRDLVDQALSGRINLSDISFSFPTDANSTHSVFPRPNINHQTPDGRVENVLQIAGVQRGEVLDFSAVDLALKAFPGFHGNLEQLLSSYRIIHGFGAIGLWCVTSPIVELQGVQPSRNQGLGISFLLRPGFEGRYVSLGITFNSARLPITIPNSQIRWTEEGAAKKGVAYLPIAAGEEFECIAIYDKRVQHIARFEFQKEAGKSDGIRPEDKGNRVLRVPPLASKRRSAAAGANGRGSPSSKTVKQLFALSGNRCAFPGCPSPLVSNGRNIGEICHIKAARAGGARFDSEQSDEDRHGFENLILFCANHHTEVDEAEEEYSVEVLDAMKRDHELHATSLPTQEVIAAARTLLASHVSAEHSGGITAHTINATNIVMAAPSPSIQSDSKAARGFFAPELSRVLAHQVWVLDRLIVFHGCSSKGESLPNDPHSAFRPKFPKLYSVAAEFSTLSIDDRTLLAEFYDATAAIDEAISSWEGIAWNFNVYNTLMHQVRHTVELGITTTEVFCPGRPFNPAAPALGTLLSRAASTVRHAQDALDRHLRCNS